MNFWGMQCPSKAFIDESNFIALMLENTHFKDIINKCNQAMRTMDHEPDINVEQLLQLMLANRVSQSFISTMT